MQRKFHSVECAILRVAGVGGEIQVHPHSRFNYGLPGNGSPQPILCLFVGLLLSFAVTIRKIVAFVGKALMIWERHSGPTPTEKTGPDNDHTYENYNSSGHYLFVNMNQHSSSEDKRKLSGFASNAVINSVVFNPPPFAHLNTSSIYQHSCLVCKFSLLLLCISIETPKQIY